MERLRAKNRWMGWVAGAALGVSSLTVEGASLLVAPPTVAQALSLKPIQPGIEYDQPTEAQRAGCQVVSAAEVGQRGWIVKDSTGKLLRRFVDTNDDNKLDQWCYYKDGVEVYRDLDTDFDEKADEYRWLGTAGTRWGLDTDENGKIDSWKRISAEEVSAEIVAAVRDKDWERFRLVLLETKELATLGLSSARQADLQKRISEARAAFEAFVKQQNVVTPTSQWAFFGGTRPALIPAGTDGSSKDILFYDNVTTMIDDGDQHRQLAIGTLVQVGEGWRVVDAPDALVSGQAMRQGSAFLQVSMAREVDENPGAAEGGFSPEVQAQLLELGKFEAQLEEAKTPAARTAAFDGYIGVLETLYRTSTEPAEKSNWIRQAADSIYLAQQRGDATGGLERLEKLAATLQADQGPIDAIAYVRYRVIESRYLGTEAESNEQFEAKQKRWAEDLEAFVKEFGESEVASDALRELAMMDEFSGKEAEALARYELIVSKYPNSANAAKARGAAWRLSAAGKPIGLVGTTIDNKPFDITKLKGKPVVVHCWATWSDMSVGEFEQLKSLQAKYAAKGLQCVGINVDMQQEDVTRFLQTQRLPWPQLFAEGGLDSELAAQFGLVTLPVMLLVDAQGKVVKSVGSTTELAAELEKLLK